MKTINKSTLFLLLIISGRVFSQGKSEVQFIHLKNWEQVIKKAQSEHKHIFVDVYTTWCGPCREMDMNVYTNQEVSTFINQEFVSIKVQMDSTKLDDDNVKSFRRDARLLNSKYKIEGYPTFLFFNSDGKLVNRDLGLKSVGDFFDLAKVSANPEFNYLNLIANFRNGSLNYKLMPDLIKAANQMKNRPLVDSLSISFKNYLNHAQLTEILTRKNLTFLASHLNLILVQDPIFNLCYEKPNLIDSLTDFPWAKDAVMTAIQNKMILGKYLTISNTLKAGYPNWNELQKQLGNKFPKVDTVHLMLQAKLTFYSRLKEWGNYSIYWTKYLKIFPVKSDFEAAIKLNNKAWGMFKSTNDKVALTNALYWCDLDIERSTAPDYLATIDTKANILYKLGKINEAIELEEKGLATSAEFENNPQFKGKVFFQDFTRNLYKMKNGIPTWPELKQ